MPSVRLWLGGLIAGIALVVFLAWRWYKAHVGYCKDSPEVAAGGGSLSCMEPQPWMAFNVALGFLALVEFTLLVAVAITVVRIRRGRRASEAQRI